MTTAVPYWATRRAVTADGGGPVAFWSGRDEPTPEELAQLAEQLKRDAAQWPELERQVDEANRRVAARRQRRTTGTTYTPAAAAAGPTTYWAARRAAAAVRCTK